MKRFLYGTIPTRYIAGGLIDFSTFFVLSVTRENCGTSICHLSTDRRRLFRSAGILTFCLSGSGSNHIWFQSGSCLFYGEKSNFRKILTKTQWYRYMSCRKNSCKACLFLKWFWESFTSLHLKYRTRIRTTDLQIRILLLFSRFQEKEVPVFFPRFLLI